MNQKSITWLTPEGDREWFPPLEQALDEPEGLLAAGGDLSPPRLLAAYRRGIFPWYSAGQPVLWWAPDPRRIQMFAQPRENAQESWLRSRLRP
jgi:leucyl/phenylalanyl-tRNA--protein transferase